MHTIFWVFLPAFFALTSSLALPRGPQPGQYGEPFFYKGFDLSSLKIEEDGGAVYKDTMRGNITRPAEDILGEHGGMNVVRLRLWVDPKVPYDGGCTSLLCISW